jgi:hypothetical protein
MQAEGITKQRLASYDRPIVSEPKFVKDQTKQLRQDLTDYLQTLKVRLPSLPLTVSFYTYSYMKLSSPNDLLTALTLVIGL